MTECHAFLIWFTPNWKEGISCSVTVIYNLNNHAHWNGPYWVTLIRGFLMSSALNGGKTSQLLSLTAWSLSIYSWCRLSTLTSRFSSFFCSALLVLSHPCNVQHKAVVFPYTFLFEFIEHTCLPPLCFTRFDTGSHRGALCGYGPLLQTADRLSWCSYPELYLRTQCL